MKSWEIEQMAREEGYREGVNEGYGNGVETINQLNIRLAEEGRVEDIVKAARDETYRKALLKEFGLE